MKKITLGLIFLAITIVSFGQWQTVGKNVYIDNGNVGIGTSYPIWSLHIKGQTCIDFTDSSDGKGRFHLNRLNSNSESMISFNTKGVYNWLLGLDNDGTNDLKFWKSPSTHVMTISYNTGNVGINTEKPSEKLEVDGNILIKNNNALILTSPNGSIFKISVDDSGNLITSKVDVYKYDKSEVDVEVYPNPVKNQLIVVINKQHTTSEDKVYTEIFDLSGKMVLMKEFKSNSFQINIANLDTGTFLLNIKDKKGNLIKSETIIKE